MIDYDKLYYSARTNKYVLIISAHNVNFDILKAIKQEFCELNNLPLDKVIIFNALYTKGSTLYGVLKNAKYIYNKLIGTNALTKISAGGKNYIHLAGGLWLENQ